MAHPWERLGFPVIEIPSLAQVSPEGAMRFLVGEMAHRGWLPATHAPEIAAQVLRREQTGSTYVGHGVAIPHVRSDFVKDVLGLTGKSAAGVPWPGPEGDVPVHEVCLVLAPAGQSGKSLRVLEAVARRLHDGGAGAD